MLLPLERGRGRVDGPVSNEVEGLPASNDIDDAVTFPEDSDKMDDAGNYTS